MPSDARHDLRCYIQGEPVLQFGGGNCVQSPSMRRPVGGKQIPQSRVASVMNIKHWKTYQFQPKEPCEILEMQLQMP